MTGNLSLKNGEVIIKMNVSKNLSSDYNFDKTG